MGHASTDIKPSELISHYLCFYLNHFSFKRFEPIEFLISKGTRLDIFSTDGASKHAIQSFSDSLRAEMSHLGIKVTVVSPAYIKTNLSMNALTDNGSNYGGTCQFIFT